MSSTEEIECKLHSSGFKPSWDPEADGTIYGRLLVVVSLLTADVCEEEIAIR